MRLPPFIVDGALSGYYLALLAPVQLVLLAVAAFARSSTLHKPHRRPRTDLKRRGTLRLLLKERGVHLVCSFLIMATYVALLVGDSAQSGDWLLIRACRVAGAFMWLGVAVLVVAEQREQRHTGRAIRLWWLLNLAAATARLACDAIRLDHAVSDGRGWDSDVWTLVRIGGYVPALVLGLIALFSADTPSTAAYAPHAPEAALLGEAATGAPAGEAPGEARGGCGGSRRNIEATASIASRMTFSWLSGTLRRGRAAPLEHRDLFELQTADATRRNEALLSAAFEREISTGRGSFIRAWHSAFGRYFWTTGALKVIIDTCTYANPLILNVIVSYLEGDTQLSPTAAVLCALGMFGASSIKSIASGQYFFRGFRLGLRTRAAVGQIVFNKALSLAHDQRQIFGTGSIVSYMQIDGQKLADSLPYLHLLWSGPIQLLVCTGMLYRFLGTAGLVGLGVMVVTTPLNTWLGRRVAAFTKATMAARDHRVKFTNEVLQGIKIAKLFTWEGALTSQLNTKREAELRAVRNNMLMNGLLSFIFTALPLIVTAVTFATYAWQGHKLTAATAFTALSLFNILRFPLLVVPMMITSVMNLAVVNGRLSKFLKAPQRPRTLVASQDGDGGGDGGGANDRSGSRPAAATAEPSAPALRPLSHDGHFLYPQPVAEGSPAIEIGSATFKWPEPIDEEAEAQEREAQRGKRRGRKRRKRPRAASSPLLPEGAASSSSTPAASSPSPTASSSEGAGDAATAAPAATAAAGGALLPPTLKSISCCLHQGSLVGVYGPVGSGKSSLLSSIIGETPRLSGRVAVRGTIALCTQEPWIQNATLRANVLFGAPYDKRLYARVLSACALEPDLLVLPGGDMTQIGERGVNLSGGQKARVALARACYAKASIVLLDDVLSAVDAEVGAHLMSKCINGLLREAGCLVLLVTHHTHWLADCDHVIHLVDGAIGYQGPPPEHLSEGHNSSRASSRTSSRLASRSASTTALADAADAADAAADAAGAAGPPLATRTPSGAVCPATPGTKSVEKRLAELASTNDGEAEKAGPNAEEDREVGTVARGVWVQYALALGWWNVALVIFCMALSQVLQFGSSWWLGQWGTDAYPQASHGKPWFYLIIYCVASTVAALAILIRAIIVCFASVRAGRTIHKRALHAVIASPMAFFDVTPLGRILNRFSGDVQKVDVTLSSIASSFLSLLLTLICTLFILGLNSVWILAALPPLAFAYFRNAAYYRASAREVQRLDSVSKSPIYAAFSEALQGASSIDAFGAAGRFRQANRERVDYNVRAGFVSVGANRWLTVRLEFFSNLLLALTALLAVAEALIGAGGASGARAGMAGLALTYAPGLTDTLNFLIRQFTMLEMEMVAMERLEKFAALPPEASVATPPAKAAASHEGHLNGSNGIGASETPPPAALDAAALDGWPVDGSISFCHVTMGYRPGLPPVLTDCSLSVPSGAKVGIVGRSGAGKSSILACLYRLVQPRSGHVTIGGVDIATVPLHTLRSRLAIIPQDPVLFTGTLRYNLDPFGARTDAELWQGLTMCGIDGAMAAHPEGLGRPVEERGSNLSMGQRQLVCLCRALLKRSPILVLDEATASVDMESDALIQRTLQHGMAGTTVLTIAHRLDTIMHTDTLIVMHEGRVAESGPPEVLRAEGGRFAELWNSRA